MKIHVFYSHKLEKDKSEKKRRRKEPRAVEEEKIISKN